MSITLVGVFDTPRQANEASRALGAVGIEQSAIRLSGDEPAATTAAREPGAISRFFSELFGTHDTDASTYVEAVQRGHVVLTLQLDDEQRADEICDILEDAGAIDVDEHVERWKTDGYQPPEAQAPKTPGSQNGSVYVHRRGHHDTPSGETDGPDPVRRGELGLHALASERQHGGSFGVGYGGTERRYRAETYVGADRRLPT